MMGCLLNMVDFIQGLLNMTARDWPPVAKSGTVVELGDLFLSNDEFAFHLMRIASKMMSLPFKMMSFVSKMMSFALKMTRVTSSRSANQLRPPSRESSRQVTSAITSTGKRSRQQGAARWRRWMRSDGFAG